MILCSDFRDALRRFCEPIDIVFLDPPYDSGFLTDALKEISDGGILSDGAVVVAEHAAGESLPETFGKLTKVKSKKYGKIGITVYENATEAEAEE